MIKWNTESSCNFFLTFKLEYCQPILKGWHFKKTRLLKKLKHKIKVWKRVSLSLTFIYFLISFSSFFLIPTFFYSRTFHVRVYFRGNLNTNSILSQVTCLCDRNKCRVINISHTESVLLTNTVNSLIGLGLL